MPAWIGRAPAEVELDLRPTFTVGGTVSWDHAATPALDAKISCSSMRGTDREELASTFVRADGTIARIKANATPYSRENIPSGEPVQLVIELNAGRAAALGITEGGKVHAPELAKKPH